MDKSMILHKKKTRIVLNPEYIERVKKENLPLQNQADALEPKTIPCRFCGYPAAVKYGGAVGLYDRQHRHKEENRQFFFCHIHCFSHLSKYSLKNNCP